MFDCQVKRIHEYKRQLLNILYIIAMYNRIKANPHLEVVKRTYFLGGKAAPGYYMAKQIIKLFNNVAEVVNNDPDVAGRMNVVFLENYRVSFAEKVIPAIELSQQISLAGMEASGTGNMKFMMNGSMTIGTLDGANVEMREECGADHFFLFGMTEPQVTALRAKGYDPKSYIAASMELNFAIFSIANGTFSKGDSTAFASIVHNLTNHDYYMHCADFLDYVRCQAKVDLLYKNQDEWIKSCIINTASSGKFSSDRTIGQYAHEIWNVHPVPPTKALASSASSQLLKHMEKFPHVKSSGELGRNYSFGSFANPSLPPAVSPAYVYGGRERHSFAASPGYHFNSQSRSFVPALDTPDDKTTPKGEDRTSFFERRPSWSAGLDKFIAADTSRKLSGDEGHPSV
jgi:hypothetical protein